MPNKPEPVYLSMSFFLPGSSQRIELASGPFLTQDELVQHCISRIRALGTTDFVGGRFHAEHAPRPKDKQPEAGGTVIVPRVSMMDLLYKESARFFD